MPSLYLLDIEGTTSPVSFVYDVLFPYARQRMKDYILAHAGDRSLDADLRLLAQENAIDRASGAPIIYLSQKLSQEPGEALQSSVAYLLWLMDKDRKSTALKSIQGKIWAEGYEQGHLHSEVFPDVPAALERWHAASRVAIYSSGSVEAQKYLFRFTGAGDLTPFISDSVRELDAARDAGLATLLSLRPGNAPVDADHNHRAIRSFDEV
jgi:enolase-phosphatase E1